MHIAAEVVFTCGGPQCALSNPALGEADAPCYPYGTVCNRGPRGQPADAVLNPLRRTEGATNRSSSADYGLAGFSMEYSVRHGGVSLLGHGAESGHASGCFVKPLGAAHY